MTKWLVAMYPVMADKGVLSVERLYKTIEVLLALGAMHIQQVTGDDGGKTNCYSGY